jgi:hypothetical protein
MQINVSIRARNWWDIGQYTQEQANAINDKPEHRCTGKMWGKTPVSSVLFKRDSTSVVDRLFFVAFIALVAP